MITDYSVSFLFPPYNRNVIASALSEFISDVSKKRFILVVCFSLNVLISKTV